MPDDKPHARTSFVMIEHPIYRPLWVRLGICLVTAGWAVFEFLYVGDGFWGVIFAGVAAYSIWTFLITYKPPPDHG